MSFSVKKMVRVRFKNWFLQIADRQKWDVQTAADEFNDQVGFYIPDHTVDLIKQLHPKGITKDELCDRYKASFHTENSQNQKRSVMKMLARLSDRKNPCYIGDQPVFLEIRHHDDRCEEPDEKSGEMKPVGQAVRRYYTENTLNPIILQANVMQTGTLLEALGYLYYQAPLEASIALGLGVDIWNQLSEYCQDRLRTHYKPRIPETDWEGFIGECADSDLAERIFPFQTEETMMEKDEVSCQERLLFLYKSGRLCRSIQYRDSDRKPRILQDQYIISKDAGDGFRFYAVDKTTKRETLLVPSSITQIVL